MSWYRHCLVDALGMENASAVMLGVVAMSLGYLLLGKDRVVVPKE